MKIRQWRLTVPAMCVATATGFALNAAAAGSISYHPITGDDDSEITNSTVYTHCVDFGSDTPRALVNGVQFQSSSSTTFGSAASTAATIGSGTTTIPTVHAGNESADPYLNGGSACAMEDLVNDMNYGDATGVITVQGLTPGKAYRFRLYNRPWGAAAANRVQTIGFDTDGIGSDIAGAEDTATFDADDARDPDPSFATFSQVYALTYDYTLSPGVSNLTVYVNAASSGTTYHMYGLSNEETGPDTNAPTMLATSPADNATGVYPGLNLEATFDEEIALSAAGTVSIKNLDAATQVDIGLPDARVTVSVGKLIINPAANLGHGTNYAVQISSNAIVDLATNAFAGVLDDVTWNFTTAAADPTAPLLVGTVPADDATNVLPNATLTAIFDEPVLIGGGNVTLYNVTDATNLMVIAISNSAAISISSNVLTITPPMLLTGGKELAVQIDAGAVKNFSEIAFAGIADASTWTFTAASETTYTGPNGSHNNDRWNTAVYWDVGVPSGPMDAILGAGKYVSVTKASSGVDTPVYTGNLTLNSNATLEIASGSVDSDLNALGGDTITMHPGSIIAFRRNADTSHDQDIVMAGDAQIDLCRSTSAHQRSRTFTGVISGSGLLSVQGVSRNWGVFATNNPAWGGGLRAYNGTSQVRGLAPGCFGTGDVTIDNSMSLQIDATNAIDDGATLNLNGSKGQIANKLIMNADDSVGALNVYGFAYPAGTYGRIGIASNVDLEVQWMSGDDVLTVHTDPGDAVAPTTIRFSNNSVDGELFQTLQSNITYTLIFNEPVVSSATTSDFENAASAPIIVQSVTQTGGTNVQVVVRADGLGDVQLRVKGGAGFEDLFGNAVSVPVTDSNVVSMLGLELYTALDILDLTRNNGVNPATGALWQDGDQYRFVFTSSTGITATATNIAVYNAFVQGLADASPLGIGASEGMTWKAIASTVDVAARDNASLSNTGRLVSVWLLDGTTLVADDYVDLFGFRTMNNAISKSETGGAPLYAGTYNDVWTGASTSGGIQNNNGLGDASGTSQGGLITSGDRHWITRFTIAQAEERPLYGISPVLTLTGPPPPGGTILIIR